MSLAERSGAAGRWAPFLLAGVLLAGCAPTATALSVEIRAVEGARVTSLTIVVEVEGMPSRTVEVANDDGPPPLPGVLVVALPDTPRAVRVRAHGELDTGVVVEANGQVTSAINSMVKLVLTLDLPKTGEVGMPCGVPEDCESGFCREGVCCDTACDTPCATCLAANGAEADGTCGPRGAGTICRDVAGTCDVAESCDGKSIECPADVFQPASHECRPKIGSCDLAESCGGAGATCPADTSICKEGEYCNGTACVPKKALGVSCGAVTECLSGWCTDGVCCNTACNDGPCDACSTTAGATVNGTCKMLGGTITCRAATGPCDQAEVCDGVMGACPADSLKAAGTSCRVAAGTCDLAEACTGSSNMCPIDKFVMGGTACRASGGVCDVVEVCSGAAAACPADVFATGGVCRASTGMCDPAESCSGASAACPANAGRGLNTAECASAGSVQCNQAIYDACGNYCGYNGTANCGPPPTGCGGWSDSTATPRANVIAGPLGGHTKASCKAECESRGAKCCEFQSNGNCYAENGDCSQDPVGGWSSALCN